MFKPSENLIRAALAATTRQHGSTGVVGVYRVEYGWRDAGRAADQMCIYAPSGARCSVGLCHGGEPYSVDPWDVPEGAEIVAFEDSWGRWWGPCKVNAAGAKGFGPCRFAKRISNREAKRLATIGHRIDVEEWGQCDDVIVAVPGAVRVMRKSR